MNIRKTTSLTMLISFVFCILTSFILYIAPHGRVAYWSDWRLLNLSKTQWSELHLNLGILLLIAGFVHLYYNWKPITSYLKNKTRELKIFSVNFNIALLLSLLVGIGTYFQVPPLVTIINISSSIKDAAGIKYGEPPYGHAELSSLKMFTGKTNLDLGKSLELLEQGGIRVESESQTILDIATMNKVVPKGIYEIIKPATKDQKTENYSAFPDSPPPGFGNKTLNEVCNEFSLNISVIAGFLSQKRIESNKAQTIKEIAAANNKEPMAIFEMISEAAGELSQAN